MRMVRCCGGIEAVQETMRPLYKPDTPARRTVIPSRWRGTPGATAARGKGDIRLLIVMISPYSWELFSWKHPPAAGTGRRLRYSCCRGTYRPNGGGTTAGRGDSCGGRARPWRAE